MIMSCRRASLNSSIGRCSRLLSRATARSRRARKNQRTDGNRKCEANVTAAKPEDAALALTQAFNFKRTSVKNLKALLEMNGHKPAFSAGDKGKIKISSGKTEVQVSEAVVNAEGKVISADEAAIEDLLNTVNASLPLDKPKPKSAKEVLSAYGYEFSEAQGTALLTEYSVPPFAVTNKSEFFRWP